jgi:aminoglycoside phosphotransferase (APT) family kinase protein
MVRDVAAHLPGFLDAVGGGHPAARETLERVFASRLRPWLRLVDPRALTLTHGDAHARNFLFPRSGQGPTFLIDWQLWHADVGARELAALIVFNWEPGRRAEVEQRLLQHYHARLHELGVADYSFAELMADYRRGVVRNLTLPILFWSRRMGSSHWCHSIDRALAAYRDLDYDELL